MGAICDICKGMAGEKMNRKGIFFSLASILVLVVVIAILSSRSVEESAQSEIEVQYHKHMAAARYIQDLESIYLPSHIKMSEKFALRRMSEYVNEEGTAMIDDITVNLSDMAYNGRSDGNSDNVMMDRSYSLKSLLNLTTQPVQSPVVLDLFLFNITSIRHLDPKTLELNSSVNLSLSSDDLVWQNQVNYSSVIDLNGVVNPAEGRRIKLAFWEENTSNSTCMLKLLDPSKSCDGVKAICPTFGCYGIY